MRVVFDTNIFISALVIPGSRAEKAIFRILDGADTLLKQYHGIPLISLRDYLVRK